MTSKNSLVIYRYCQQGNSKTRPAGFSKKTCLETFVNNVPASGDVLFVVDGVLPEGIRAKMAEVGTILQANLGSNLNSWLMTLSHALVRARNYDKIYFVEDDYAHRASLDATLKALDISGVDYVSPYLSPDYHTHAFHRNWNFDFENDREFIAAKSTCLTFACRTTVFVDDYRHMVAFGLKDSVMWSALTARNGRDRIIAFTTSRSRGIGGRSAILNDLASARLGTWRQARTLVVPKQSHSVHLEAGKIHPTDHEWVEHLLSGDGEDELDQEGCNDTNPVPRL